MSKFQMLHKHPIDGVWKIGTYDSLEQFADTMLKLYGERNAMNLEMIGIPLLEELRGIYYKAMGTKENPND